MSLLAQEKLGQIDLIELGASFDWIHLRTFPHRLKKEARLLVCKYRVLTFDFLLNQNHVFFFGYQSKK